MTAKQLQNTIANNNLKISKHFFERMEERGITAAEIAECLKMNPYHRDTNKYRLTSKSIHIVISSDFCLITTYRK